MKKITYFKVVLTFNPPKRAWMVNTVGEIWEDEIYAYGHTCTRYLEEVEIVPAQKEEGYNLRSESDGFHLWSAVDDIDRLTNFDTGYYLRLPEGQENVTWFAAGGVFFSKEKAEAFAKEIKSKK